MPPRDAQKYNFNQKCAKFLYFSSENHAWEAYSGDSRSSKWEDEAPSSDAVGAEFERRSRRGGGCVCLRPRKKIDFGSQIGEFLCNLGAFRVHLVQ